MTHQCIKHCYQRGPVKESERLESLAEFTEGNCLQVHSDSICDCFNSIC